MDDPRRKGTRDEKRAFWREHIEGWKLGTQSQKDYCASHGLSSSMFHRWRARFKYEDDIVERRASSRKKKMSLKHAITVASNQTLLAERVRVLRTRLAKQNPAAAQGEGDAGDSRISSAR